MPLVSFRGSFGAAFIDTSMVERVLPLDMIRVGYDGDLEE